MNKRQENTKDSYQATDKVLDDNSAVVSGHHALNDAVTIFKTDFGGIEAVETAFNDATKGKTDAKHEAENNLITKGYPVVCALRSLGKKNNDTVLQAIAKVKVGNIEKLSDAEIPTFWKDILGKANSNAAVLATNYNISADYLTSLQGCLDAFTNSFKAQGGGMANRTSAHDALKKFFLKLSDDLKEVDDMMECVKEDNPEFYDAYHAARIVKALGTRHRKAPAPPASQAMQK